MSTLPALIPPLEQWPADLRYEFEERVAIKIDSGTPVERAEAEAMAETWGRK